MEEFAGIGNIGYTISVIHLREMENGTRIGENRKWSTVCISP
jgi:hypothetical protein